MTKDDRTGGRSGRLKEAARLAARAVAAASRWLNVLGITVLGTLIAITVADVLGRTIFNKSILGTFELTEYMLSMIVFSTIAWCAVAKSHIKVDIFTSHLNARAQLVITLITHTFSLGFVVVLTWQCFVEALFITQMGKSSTMLDVPAHPFYWLMSIGFLLLSMQLFVDIIAYISKVKTK